MYHKSTDEDPIEKQFTKVHRMSGEAKIEGITSFISELLESKFHLNSLNHVIDDVKFIVYAHHILVMDALAKHLDFKLAEIKEKAYNYIRIDGKTPTDVRQEYVKEFQDNENCRVALLSITAASNDVNLSASSIVVFAEVSF